MYDTRWSFAGFIQYNSAADAVLGNFRLRFNPKEGTDLYIVYNEDFNTNNTSYDPNLPISNERLILVKYSYTFKL